VNERPGRESRLLRAFLHQFHRNVLVRRSLSQVKPAPVHFFSSAPGPVTLTS
jgi:hypothetical protein